ncbi:malonate transporter subunit MadL [Tuanshanicoccus lijuaniae]|uniref:malonate transporter subunit MadL n=1 Tax=Aerococcaceae bacterium zg-1292 TaxID=2774330 RepID=UPI001937AA38|nr:malonate transporter subunit MadL [Aerococcaceae bacterium zg-1292]MBF6626422.1 malonate transporter subunit MadL [Aerococcaceae bacterium zg-BR9]MBS4455705.1 malonate transporter subunit MadL [Aerococcaceae bacterium zg-A91]MBS4457456.1 malonate transporter subunit MadL [Aerococcaceae bacterium zg-BR33]QQA37098.1 malonate transporter subunit MadL [Aerococcaceae bacterium zg-1292]
MEIYGLGIVGVCMFIGSFIGRLLGSLLGINGDVGGVGFSMIILILLMAHLEKRGTPLNTKTSNGIKFLSSLYIPIVVAMSSIQNVKGALESGLVAILAGALAILAALGLVPVISKLSRE